MRQLIRAGLKRDSTSTDVVVVSEGEAVYLYVAKHNDVKARALAAFFQAQPWTAAVFARGTPMPGTFPLSMVHLDHSERAADLVVALTWRSDTNAYGVRGTHAVAVDGVGGPIATGEAGHGGLSPYAIRSTMIAAGPAFGQARSVDTPVGNVDVAPTILAMLGLKTEGTDGRVLREALVGGPAPTSLETRTDTMVTTTHTPQGVYRSALQVTTVDGEVYVDQAWRVH
jgi:hypothetical protein